MTYIPGYQDGGWLENLLGRKQKWDDYWTEKLNASAAQRQADWSPERIEEIQQRFPEWVPGTQLPALGGAGALEHITPGSILGPLSNLKG